MKKFVRALAALVAVITLASAAVSCKNNNADTPPETSSSAGVDTSTPTVETDPPYTEPEAPDPEELFDTPETFTIEKKDYAANVEIIRSENSESGSLDIKKAQYLRMYISDKIGVSPALGTDWAKEEDSEKFEIIFGATDHPETEALLKTLSYGEWAVRAIGNKIIVMAFSENGYELATAHLASVLGGGIDKSTKTITVKTEDLNKTEKCDDQLGALPTYDGGRFLTAYDAGRVTSTTDCDEIIVKETTPEEYGVYLSKLAANGYTKYTSTEIGANKFATYTSELYTVNAGYYDYEKAARILIEPKGALPTLAENNNTEKVTTSEITMLGGAPDAESQNGLSVVIRLEDGRFIVIDGGYNRDGACEAFINCLKDRSKGYTSNPTVAAWIITHPHGDHSGMLYGKYQKIKDAGIKIESFMINEMSQFEIARSVSYATSVNKPGTYNFPSSDNIGSTKNVLNTIAPAFNSTVYKPHIGQIFNISNCKIEVLYTLEGYAPKICNTMNTTSVVMKMTFKDTATGKETTMLSTGDATGFAMGVANNIFSDYLKSDIITVNHHGYTSWGGDSQIMAAYKKVAPTLLLWPVGDAHYGDLSLKAYNQPLFKTESYKESYNAGEIGEEIVVPLPYVVGNVIDK